MKDSILKKIISLLLSVTLAVGMNGVPVWAEGSASPENGIAGHAAEGAFTVTMDDITTVYEKAEEFAQVWKDIQGKTAEIHLLQDLDVGRINFDIEEYNHDDNRQSIILTGEKLPLQWKTVLALMIIR